MPSLSIFTFSQWNNMQIAGAQTSANTPLDFSTGSIPLALVEANSSVALYQQASILQLAAASRAATATGSDLDSFYADFNFYRLPATYSTGVATLFRSNTTTGATIAANSGISVLSPDGVYAYEIVSDSTQPYYVAADTQYELTALQSVLAVTTQCQTVGSAPNAAIGVNLLLGDGLDGFDTAVTTSGFINGYDAETDEAFRARFNLYINSRSQATITAIASAVANTQVNIRYKIINNTNPSGGYEAGNVQILVDDGSGNPPDSLLTAVNTNVDLVRGATISTNIGRPVVVPASIAFTCVLLPGIDPTQVSNAVATVVTNYVNNISIGQILSITRLSAIVYNVTNYIDDVQNVIINGSTTDLVITSTQVIKLAVNGLVVSIA